MTEERSGMQRLLDATGPIDDRVAAAFLSIDRADFVPERHRDEAYLDRPVPIPRKQTTSQPSLIARMVEAARIEPDDRALEIGAGLGFQTALMARLARRIVSVERFEELAEAARGNLVRAGIDNASVVVGDGWEGHVDEAPYDAIVVSAAATEVPDPLVDQLAQGARLVIPVASRRSDDVLIFEKRGRAVERIALLTPARFVPLVRGRSS